MFHRCGLSRLVDMVSGGIRQVDDQNINGAHQPKSDVLGSIR